jgi:hypothetical protein
VKSGKTLALGVALALLLGGTAQAADTYRITAGGNQDWGPDTGALDQTASTPLEATGTETDDGPAVGTVDYHLQAGPGIARASMNGHVAVPSGLAYPFNPSMQAVSTTELTISGPAFEITTSLNLHVDGTIDATQCPGGPPCGTLTAFIFAPSGTTAGAGSEFTSLGAGRENDMGLQLEPVPGGYHVHGDVTSREFGLRTGTPIPLGIVLNLSGRFGGNAAGETFAADMEVSFAPSGPVLNLPAGYTVSGANVVNNRWDDPFAGNLVVADCDDPALAQATTIRGSLILRDLPGCPALTLPQLEHIGGDVIIDGNAGDVGVDLGNSSVGGAIDVSGNGGDLTVDVGSVGEAIDVSGTGGDLTIDAGSVGEAIDVSGTGGDLTIDPGTTGGDLDISENPDADSIDAGNGQIGGDVTITDNGTAAVNANDSLTVSGDADVESDGGGMLDLSGVDAAGDETVVAGDADGVSANTAGGTTDVSILGGTAAMHVVLPDGAFDQPVAFTVTRRGDDPAEGDVDPLAGYAFAFAVPTLNADARLSFTVDLAALDATTRAALLAGNATLVTKPDAPGSAYSAFARCTGAQTPETDGCVTVTMLAADGSVAPAGAEPALARFDGVAGHFSTWAVARLLAHAAPPSGATPPPAATPPLGSVAARPTRAQIRALLRRQIAPRGRAARIGALLRHGYRLRFRALTAGTAKVGWYRHRVLIARGRHTFAGAGRATIAVKLTHAGRRQLRHARRLRLTARGAFASVSAARGFTLQR